jgi:hypothetical protein
MDKPHKKLDVWNLAVELVSEVYRSRTPFLRAKFIALPIRLDEPRSVFPATSPKELAGTRRKNL